MCIFFYDVYIFFINIKVIYLMFYLFIYYLLGNWMSALGSYGALCMVIPILLAFPVVRRHFYNLFYFSHLFLHVGIVFLWLHASGNFYYMLPSIGLYAIDITIRLISRFSPNSIQRIHTELNGIVRIDFDLKDKKSVSNYLPGQFVRVCFPSVNSLEWHPHSLCGKVIYMFMYKDVIFISFN